MPNEKNLITHLSEKEARRRLNNVVRKLRKTFTLDRWKTAEELDKNFLMETWAIEADIRKLGEALKLTKHIDWHHKRKR